MTAIQPATTQMTADLETVRAMFTDSLLVVKPTTRATYSRSLKSFFAWVAETGRDIANMTPRDVNAYREHLLAKVNPDGSRASALTVTAYLVAVRKFYEWTSDEGVHPNVAEKVRGASRDPKFQRRPLTTDQARKLLAYYRNAGRLRDYAIVSLLLQTGMRTAEVVNAMAGGLQITHGNVLLYFRGKARDHDRDYVILSETTHRAIKEYLAAERPDLREDSPLFTSHSNRNQGGPMDTRSIRRIVEEGLDAIGLNGRQYTAHSLRHTTAVTLLELGASLEDVRAEMRHRSSDTTRIYLREIEERQRLTKATATMLDQAFQ